MVGGWQLGPLIKRAELAPFASIEALCGSGGVLVLAPHPDDESLGCGAAIAEAAKTGRQVVVAVVTDGTKSHPRSKLVPCERLAALRQEEVEAAVHELTGRTDAVCWLGHPDGSVPTSGEAAEAIVDRLVELARTIDATALWATWRYDPHCDHEAVASHAEALRRRLPHLLVWSFPIWGRFREWPPQCLPEPRRLVLLDGTRMRQLKARAVASHRSQMTQLIVDDPDGFVMDQAMQRHFIEHPEIFIAAA